MSSFSNNSSTDQPRPINVVADRPTKSSPDRWVARSKIMTALQERAQRAAIWSDHPILITGPIGSGKSHLARHIHALSSRKKAPLEIIDCGGLSDLDNLLVGHRRGAFTGADGRLDGRLQRAHGGTIVLDDFERLSSQHQDLFHRVVVDGVFHPIGAANAHKTDVRFIATTNADLESELDNGRLKSDFLSRLDYFHLQMPPLAARPEDLPDLCKHLLQRQLHHLEQQGIGEPGREVRFDADCWPILASRNFSDNVRGLDKLIVRLLAHIENRDLIWPRDIEAVNPISTRTTTPWFDEPKTLRKVREDAERRYILEVCRQTGFNMRATARALEISPKCLYEKLKRYGISRP